jgi:biotin synthase
MEKNEIHNWLREQNPDRLDQLWQQADLTRQQVVGDAVHLRGLIEISNHCVRQCEYCGLRSNRKTLQRYRMDEQEIMRCVAQAVEFGYGTVVIQAGEDYGIKTQWLADIINRIKSQTPLAVTLSMGERPVEDLRTWRQAGADRYLLRFETSDPRLYQKIHPPQPSQTWDRLDLLTELRKLGYEVGSGVMIGIPGQTFDSLAVDIDMFRRLDLDMIGVGPYISHPDTPLARRQPSPDLPPEDQVPNSELMVYKVIALARIVCPEANIPSTTALATINIASGRELGLSRGANVVMPNLTPTKYRQLYEIYPDKACIHETAGHCHNCLQQRIESLGRHIATGPGGRDHHTENRKR